MKAAAILLLALACSAHALSLQRGVESSVEEAHPRVAETLSHEAASQQLVRARRSPDPPLHGSVTADVRREAGVGTVLQAQGQADVWRSLDGRSSIAADGQFSKVIDDHGHGRSSSALGATFQHQLPDGRGSMSASVRELSGLGTVLQAQGQAKVWESRDGRNRLLANGEWSKVLGAPSSYNYGATFEHRFPDSRGAVSAGVLHQPGLGTVLQAQGRGNLWTSRDGRGSLDAYGQYSRAFGGPGGGRPNYNFGATFGYRF